MSRKSGVSLGRRWMPETDEEAVSFVVDVAGVLEQYNLCVRDVSGCRWRFSHENYNDLLMNREDKKVDWRKRVSYCLQPKHTVPYSQRRFHLSVFHLGLIQDFLQDPFALLEKRMVTTLIWDAQYGGQRRMVVYKLTPYFTRQRLVAIRKLDSLFRYWRVYDRET